MEVSTIKHVQKSTAWGVKNSKTGKVVNKYGGCADVYIPGISRVTGMLVTNLTSTEEEEFEKQLRLKKGDLAPTSEFWDTFRITIPDEGLVLTENPLHALYKKVMSGDPEVAISEADLKFKPSAKYIITSEVDKASEANKTRKVKNKAIAAFTNLSPAEINDYLALYEMTADNMDPEVAYNRLGEFVEKTPVKFLSFVEDPLLKDKFFIIRCVKLGVIRKQTFRATFDQPLLFNEVKLGDNLTESIQFLKAGENQNIMIAVKKQIETLNKVKSVNTEV